MDEINNNEQQNQNSLVLRTEGLVKRYGKRTVANGVSINVKQGEIVGLLGPNGAGKTTTIKMLSMLLRPTAGEIAIGGFNLKHNEQEIKTMIGVVPQHFNLDYDLTVWENLILHGKLHKMEASYIKQRSTELLEYVELLDRKDDFVQKLSGGMKRRLMIARALMHNPKILFLDEPTVGLDPQVRRKLWDLIRKMHNDNVAVLLTTHYIEEAENLCNRVAIMEKGSLIALDSPKELCNMVGKYVIEYEIENKLEYKFFDTREEASNFACTLVDTAIIRKSNLEDVFVELTGRTVN